MIKRTIKGNAKIVILIALTVFSIMATGLGQDAHAQLIFEDGFESGTINPNWYSQIQIDGTWYPENTTVGGKIATQIAETGVSRNGSYAARYVCERCTRTESTNPNGILSFQWGREYWVGFSFNMIVRPTGYGLIHQHHASASSSACVSGPNGFSMAMKNGDLVFAASTNDSLVNVTPTGGAGWGSESLYTLTDPQTNRWYDVVLHFKYATDSTGYFQIWLDGSKIVDEAGVTTYALDNCGLPRGRSNYLKIGVYSGGGVGDIYYDDFRVGDGSSSYAEVAPPGAPSGAPPVTISSIVEWGAPSYATNEGNGTATFTISRSGDTSASALVDWRTAQNTASVENDYIGVAPTTVTFAPGETSKLVSLSIVDDTEVESYEDLTIMLVNPTGVSLGSVVNSVVTIADNDNVVSLGPPQNLLIIE